MDSRIGNVSKADIEVEAKRICAEEALVGLWKWSELKDAAKDELRKQASENLQNKQK